MMEKVFRNISACVRWARENNIRKDDVVGIYEDSGGEYHLVYYGK